MKDIIPGTEIYIVSAPTHYNKYIKNEFRLFVNELPARKAAKERGARVWKIPLNDKLEITKRMREAE